MVFIVSFESRGPRKLLYKQQFRNKSDKKESADETANDPVTGEPGDNRMPWNSVMNDIYHEINKFQAAFIFINLKK